jgi:hypothetical protein
MSVVLTILPRRGAGKAKIPLFWPQSHQYVDAGNLVAFWWVWSPINDHVGPRDVD